jgi:aryl-alcohol dehydrogenase-like predicted oxidoreductase/enamine deaminase RidA (YjgF/YER057c/UK114 family)
VNIQEQGKEDDMNDKVIIGLWQVADMERSGRTLDPDAAADALQAYRDEGFQRFDMADHYGSAEEICGRLREKHGAKDLFCQTKWVPPPGKVTPADVEAAVTRALRRLRTERIDLMQFHAWNYADPSWLDALFELDRLREKGLIDRLGLTNFDEAHLNMIIRSGIPVYSNQVCCSLLDRRAFGAMSDTCRRHGVRLFAFGTLAGGFLSERWLGMEEPVMDERLTWSQMKYKRYIDVAGGWAWFQRLLGVLDGIAKARGVSISALAGAWVLGRGAVDALIIGVRPGERQHRGDMKSLSRIVLSPSEEASIREVLSAGREVPGDCGDEYRKPPFLTASGDLSHHLDAMPPPYPTVTDSRGRTRAFSGTTWEDMAGYCRAVRVGDRILVSGTTASHGDRLIGGCDPAAQAHFAIDKIEGALQSLGGRLEDVVRTRVLVSDIAHWEPVARAHGRRFGEIRPVNTLVQAPLVGSEYLVEIEAEAIVSRPPSNA